MLKPLVRSFEATGETPVMKIRSKPNPSVAFLTAFINSLKAPSPSSNAL